MTSAQSPYWGSCPPAGPDRWRPHSPGTLCRVMGEGHRSGKDSVRGPFSVSSVPHQPRSPRPRERGHHRVIPLQRPLLGAAAPSAGRCPIPYFPSTLYLRFWGICSAFLLEWEIKAGIKGGDRALSPFLPQLPHSAGHTLSAGRIF